MAKERSKKFWITFWIIATIFLVGWYMLLQYHREGINIGRLAEIIPLSDKYKAVAFLSEYVMQKDDAEKTFLVLFQNNMEIRPGGGFIGSFGIVKVKNGQIIMMQIHDSGNFDGRVPQTVPAPYPIPETLRVKWLQLRDSNWSPDFPTNVNQAEEFYRMGKGEEKFDGVVGITTNVLTSFLKATGPVSLESYPGTYADEGAILALEYQVEKGFEEQGITRGDRKSVMGELATAISKKVFELDTQGKIKLAEILADDLDKKDITLYFKDQQLQDRVAKAGWNGAVDQDWAKDYLMAVDANLGAWKSDAVLKRSMEYTVDLSEKNPKVTLKITYDHSAGQRDFMTKDYFSYLRVYVPEGTWLESYVNFEAPRFGSELGKKYLGGSVRVPLGQTKTVELYYRLPESVRGDYDLKIQKQIGIHDVPVKVHVLGKNGGRQDYEFTMNQDIVLNK